MPTQKHDDRHQVQRDKDNARTPDKNRKPGEQQDDDDTMSRPGERTPGRNRDDSRTANR
jgi:hypothetical protein